MTQQQRNIIIGCYKAAISISRRKNNCRDSKTWMRWDIAQRRIWSLLNNTLRDIGVNDG